MHPRIVACCSLLLWGSFLIALAAASARWGELRDVVVFSRLATVRSLVPPLATPGFLAWLAGPGSLLPDADALAAVWMRALAIAGLMGVAWWVASRWGSMVRGLVIAANPVLIYGTIAHARYDVLSVAATAAAIGCVLEGRGRPAAWIAGVAVAFSPWPLLTVLALAPVWTWRRLGLAAACVAFVASPWLLSVESGAAAGLLGWLKRPAIASDAMSLVGMLGGARVAEADAGLGLLVSVAGWVALALVARRSVAAAAVAAIAGAVVLPGMQAHGAIAGLGGIAVLAWRDRRMLASLALLSLVIVADMYLLARLDGLAPAVREMWGYDPRRLVSPYGVATIVAKVAVCVAVLVPDAVERWVARAGEDGHSRLHAALHTLSLARPRLRRSDWLMLAALALVSFSLTFVRLGASDRPTSAVTGNLDLVLEASPESPIAELWLYKGLEDLHLTAHCSDASAPQRTTVWSYESFGWYYRRLLSPCAGQLTLELRQAPSAVAFEILFADGAGNRIAPRLRSPSAGAVLLDEGHLVAGIPGRYDGGFFDEGVQIQDGLRRRLYTAVGAEPSAHPLLGRALIHGAMSVLGPVPLAWRLPDALAGAVLPLVLFAFALSAFGRRDAAYVVAALSLLDSGRLSLSRVATTDSQLVLWTVLQALFAWLYLKGSVRRQASAPSAPPWLFLLLAGLASGAAVGTKWSGLFLLPLVGLVFVVVAWRDFVRAPASTRAFLAARHAAFGALCLCVAPVAVYVIGYAPFVDSSGTAALAEIAAEAQRMLSFHSGFVSDSPYHSQFVEWPWLTRPLAMFARYGLASDRGELHFMIGNPIVYWAVVPCVAYAILTGAVRRVPGIAFAVAAFLLTYLAWAAVGRRTYLYHFAPVLPFALLVVGVVVADLARRSPRGAAVYLAAAGVVFCWFLPVAAGLEVSSAYLASVSWFPKWLALLDPHVAFL